MLVVATTQPYTDTAWLTHSFVEAHTPRAVVLSRLRGPVCCNCNHRNRREHHPSCVTLRRAKRCHNTHDYCRKHADKRGLHRMHNMTAATGGAVSVCPLLRQLGFCCTAILHNARRTTANHSCSFQRVL